MKNCTRSKTKQRPLFNFDPKHEKFAVNAWEVVCSSETISNTLNIVEQVCSEYKTETRDKRQLVFFTRKPATPSLKINIKQITCRSLKKRYGNTAAVTAFNVVHDYYEGTSRNFCPVATSYTQLSILIFQSGDFQIKDAYGNSYPKLVDFCDSLETLRSWDQLEQLLSSCLWYFGCPGYHPAHDSKPAVVLNESCLRIGFHIKAATAHNFLLHSDKKGYISTKCQGLLKLSAQQTPGCYKCLECANAVRILTESLKRHRKRRKQRKEQRPLPKAKMRKKTQECSKKAKVLQ